MPEPTSQPIIPVFEVFGYARCPNCSIVEKSLDSLKQNLSDSVVVLQYHMRTLGDTLSPESILERQNLYNIGSSAPVTIIHGEERIEGSSGVSLSMFENYYRALRSREDSLGLKVTYIDEGDTARMIIGAAGEFSLERLKLFVFLTRDSIIFKQPGAPDSIFNNVVTFYRSSVAAIPYEMKVDKNLLIGGNFVAFLQDTVNLKIISVLQRRF
ncbi:MAG: hypothetical protein QMD82_02690 [bacterium]|nr:hypothetical protein [bacterium]